MSSKLDSALAVSKEMQPKLKQNLTKLKHDQQKPQEDKKDQLQQQFFEIQVQVQHTVKYFSPIAEACDWSCIAGTGGWSDIAGTRGVGVV